MNPRQFAFACAAQKAEMMQLYADATKQTAVTEILAPLRLDGPSKAVVLAAVDAALTDAFYTMLVALDGCATLGADQQQYRLYAEDGQLLTDKLEVHAYAAFYEAAGTAPPNTSLERTREG
jgi:hypothetical protein